MLVAAEPVVQHRVHLNTPAAFFVDSDITMQETPSMTTAGMYFSLRSAAPSPVQYLHLPQEKFSLILHVPRNFCVQCSSCSVGSVRSTAAAAGVATCVAAAPLPVGCAVDIVGPLAATSAVSSGASSTPDDDSPSTTCARESARRTLHASDGTAASSGRCSSCCCKGIADDSAGACEASSETSRH